MHCDIGQDLAIQFDTRKLQTVHELAIGQAFHAYGGVDALNPERTEAALLYLAIAIGVLASLFDCLPRDADGVLAAAIIALRLIQDILRSEEHTSELQSLMRISYAVFCLKKKKTKN